MSDRRRAIFSSFRRTRAPGVCEWLERNITLPKGFTVSPGPVRFSGREFMKFPLELHHPESGCTDLVISAGTQLLKTAGMLLGKAYRMVWCPSPTLIVTPSLDFSRDFMFRQRLGPLIEENPVLRELMPVNQDDYKQLSLAMRGGTIDLAGANSPTNLSGRTVGDVLQDECCKFETRSRKEAPEAHPMLLADERAKAYGSLAFRYKSSSPNIPSHPFWQAVEAGTQTVLAVPCPECREWFHFDWHLEKGSEYISVVWDRLAKDKEGRWDLDRVRVTARYACPHCGYQIPSGEKPGMIRQCQEHDLNPGASRSRRSYIIPSFYSPTISFGDIAVKWLEREKDLFHSGTRNIINSWFARPYTETAVEIRGEDIRKLVSSGYRRGTVPFEPVFVLLTADPGDTSGTHWMVSAGAENGDIAVLDWGVAVGVPALEQVRRSGALRYQIGGTRKLVAPGGGYIDSRYDTDTVLQMCAESGGFWTPTAGSDARYGNWTSVPVRSHPGIRRFVFVDLTLKNELYDKRIAKGEGPRILLPGDADEGLLSQLSGQSRDANTGQWKRLPNDHWGDCLKQVVLAQWIRAAVLATVEAAEAGRN